MSGGYRYKTFLTYLQSKLDRANALLSVVRKEGAIETPSSLEEELRVAESQKAAVLEKFSESHDEEATVSILNEAGDRMSKLVYEALRLCLLSAVQIVRDECKYFKGDEDLAAQYIPNYDTHIKNFQKIEELLDDWTSCGKRLELDQVRNLRGELEDFLDAIEIGKPKIAAVKARGKEEEREKEEEKRVTEERFQTSIKATNKNTKVAVVGVIVAIIFGVIEIVKGCSDSSQQTTPPEATVSGVEP